MSTTRISLAPNVFRRSWRFGRLLALDTRVVNQNTCVANARLSSAMPARKAASPPSQQLGALAAKVQ